MATGLCLLSCLVLVKIYRMNPNSNRISYLDWLRVLAIAGVLLYHSARPFIYEDPWHINNVAKSDMLTEFNFWLSRFRMPLLFFISGAVSWFMIKKRTAGSFVLLRLRRLFIPLLVGILLVVPPQVYAERLTQGYTGSYWDFYKTIFRFESYPAGNFSWHHLWFIAYLFVYDLSLAPFFAWCKSGKAKGFIRSLFFFAKAKNVYVLMIPSVVLYSLLVLDHPSTNDLIHDPLYFTYWLIFLLTGFICILQPAIMDSLERNRRFSLSLAFVLLLGINALRWTDFEWFDHVPDAHDWRTYLYLARQPINTWCWLFAIVGYGKRYLSKTHPAMEYINQLIYPFYILHQTVIVVIAYFVVRSADGVGMKYAFIVLTSLAVSLSVFHLFIRPYRITRFLFGMKPGSREKKRTDKKTAPLAQDLPVKTISA